MTAPQPTLWEFVPRLPATDLIVQLVQVARELEKIHTLEHGPLYGVTIGEVVYRAETRDIKVGGVPMANKIMEQRQTSWLARVMRVAGFVPTGSYRASPVKRHHGNPHRVYVRREVKP